MAQPSWTTIRQTPYTEIGIQRLRCMRCGQPARFQWSICADGNNYRPLCATCDILLNAMVLEWAGCPPNLIREKLSEYVDYVTGGQVNAHEIIRELVREVKNGT